MSDPAPHVDGIRPAAPSGAPVPAIARSRAKHMLLMILGIPYVLYLLWCFFLISALPSTTGTFDSLVPVGLLSALVAGIGFLVIGFFALRRILRSTATPPMKTRALMIMGLVTVPGILASLLMPLLITREPPLSIGVLSPTDPAEFVAPVAVTFDLSEAVEILGRKNLRPVSFRWDFDGDGEQNEETVVPQATALFEQPGNYAVAARIELADGSNRLASRRLLIPAAVFSVNPARPIAAEPVTFSVAHLAATPEDIREVRWDFDGDGVAEETVLAPSVSHVFSRTGTYTVGAEVLFQNQSQQTYKRQITVIDAPEQPFALSIQSDPRQLLSPPPFGTIFTLTTEEVLREVLWDFGDGTVTTKTSDEHRVGHTFEARGTFRVTATALATSGETAVASVVVQVVDPLRLSDLVFDGEPSVVNNRITGEAPLSITLTPVTSAPLIEFSWDAPDATSVGSTETTLQALYRKPGTYKLTLFARDPGGKAMREQITVEVEPPDSVVQFTMDPENGVAPLKVRLDASETAIPGETISAFEWTIGDELTGITRLPPGIAVTDYTFEKQGRYPITLVVTTTAGNTYEATNVIAVMPPKLEACFLPSRTSGSMDGKPFGVSFDRSCSVGAIAKVVWDFGDASQSDDLQENIVHVYEAPGTFTVRLTVSDASGAQSSTTHQITLSP